MPALALAAVLLALAVYRLVPSLVKWIDSRSRRISDSDVRATEHVVATVGDQLNDRLVEALTNSKSAERWVDDRVWHRWLSTVQGQVMGMISAIKEENSQIRDRLDHNDAHLGQIDIHIATLTERVAGVPDLVASRVIDKLNDAGLLRRRSEDDGEGGSGRFKR